MTIILPTPPNGEQSIETRWSKACKRDDMREWYSYSTRLMQWAFELFQAGSTAMAETMRFLSNLAYQRYLDLHPVREAEAA